jgi:hypothetical protein
LLLGMSQNLFIQDLDLVARLELVSSIIGASLGRSAVCFDAHRDAEEGNRGGDE